MINHKNGKQNPIASGRDYCQRAKLNFGWVNIFYKGKKIVKIALGLKGKGKSNPKLTHDIKRVLTEGIEHSDLQLDLTGLTPFEKKVLNRCSEIKFGEVLSYGELARVIGKPRAGRAVGRVMAKNPLPLLFPCHRVIHSDGRLGGFTAGCQIKKRLLENEGWQVRGTGPSARVRK